MSRLSLAWVACACALRVVAGGSAWDAVQAALRSTDGDGWALVAGRADSPQPLLAYAGSKSTGLDAAIPVASAAKWVSGTVVLRLVQEGTMRLDDRVQRYLPSWGVNSADGRGNITLRHLLTFTSGITDAVPSCDAWRAIGQRAAPDSLAPLADCVTRIAHATPRLVADPVGTVFAYAGFNPQRWQRLRPTRAGQPCLRKPPRRSLARRRGMSRLRAGTLAPSKAGWSLLPSITGGFWRWRFSRTKHC